MREHAKGCRAYLGNSNIKVGLVQINWDLEWQHSETAKGQDSVSFHFLPYSVGLLQAYAQHYLTEPGKYEWLPQIYSRCSVARAVDGLAQADVVGFSCYVWNVEISLAIARELKRVNPDVLVVFGGPHVPDRSEEFLRANRCIDLACHGEGEAPFTQILEVAPTRDWSDVAAISYLDDADQYVVHPKAGRTKELSEIPSPYLTGTFDGLMSAHPDEQWVMAWETNRGCPFSCTFCDWGSATASRVYSFDMDRLEAEIAWCANHKITSIVCCDANFGMLPRDLEIIQKVIGSRKRTGFPYAISIQNAKNSTERSYEIQKLLADNMRTIGVTLSLQTTNKETLKNIRRANIRSESFQELQRRFTRDGIYTYSDIIIGLPGETYDGFAQSVSQVVADGQNNHIQFHNCSILPNAEMGDPAYIARYGLSTVPQPIRSCYSRLEEVPEVEEYLDTVVSTTAMPKDDWVRTKVFAWYSDLLYFDRLIQIPIMVSNYRTNISYRYFIEAITEANYSTAPTVAWANEVLSDKARHIQSGGLEFFEGSPGGDFLWPADQYLYVSLVASGKLRDFYQQAQELIGQMMLARGASEEDLIFLDESFSLNSALLKLPHVHKDTFLVLSHDVYSAYKAISQGDEPDFTEQMTRYQVARSRQSWDRLVDWAEFLTWCQGRDKRDYFYETVPTTSLARGA